MGPNRGPSGDTRARWPHGKKSRFLHFLLIDSIEHPAGRPEPGHGHPRARPQVFGIVKVRPIQREWARAYGRATMRRATSNSRGR